MLTWLSANLINITLIAVLVLIVALVIRNMVRDRKAGKRSCGGNCASCGACGGCSACGSCKSNAATMNNRTNSVSGKPYLEQLRTISETDGNHSLLFSLRKNPL